MKIINGRTILASAALAAFGLGTAAPTLATPQYGYGQHASNSNVWRVRRRIERDIDQLQQDQRDYGGHRVRAIEFLNGAHNELLQAEQYEHDHGVTPGASVDPNGFVDRGGVGSDRNLWAVRSNVEWLYSQLQRDASDYGGHKAAAMRQMQAARAQLVAAERYDRSHG